MKKYKQQVAMASAIFCFALAVFTNGTYQAFAMTMTVGFIIRMNRDR